LHDAGASERDYLLTGNAAYLEAFTNAEHSFPAAFERIAASVRHDPAGQSDLIELRRLVDLELADLRRAVALRAEKVPQGQRQPPALTNPGQPWTASVKSSNGGTMIGVIFCPPAERVPAAK
jgi:hypothetical protein